MRHNLVAEGTINMASRLVIATCSAVLVPKLSTEPSHMKEQGKGSLGSWAGHACIASHGQQSPPCLLSVAPLTSEVERTISGVWTLDWTATKRLAQLYARSPPWCATTLFFANSLHPPQRNKGYRYRHTASIKQASHLHVGAVGRTLQSLRTCACSACLTRIPFLDGGSRLQS